MSNAIASNTQAAYKSAWQLFEAWAELNDHAEHSPEIVATYFVHLASGDAPKSMSTIEAHRAAIRKAYELKQLESPTEHQMVKMVLKGLRRDKNVRTRPNKKKAATMDVIEAMLRAIQGDESTKAKRDRAILWVGLTGAFRRSELAGLNIEDVEFGAKGAEILLRSSKTDQEGARPPQSHPRRPRHSSAESLPGGHRRRAGATFPADTSRRQSDGQTSGWSLYR